MKTDPNLLYRKQLAAAVMATWELAGDNPLTSQGLAMVVDDLIRYAKEDVALALQKARRECKGRLAVQDILKHLDSSGGHPQSAEAWAIAIHSVDERHTVIWTKQIRDAFQGVRATLEAGDRFGARQAFVAKYDLLIEACQRQGEQAVFETSLGDDHRDKVRVLEEGIILKRLSTTHKALTDSALTAPEPTHWPLLSRPASGGEPKHVRERLAALRLAAEGLSMNRSTSEKNPEKTT